MPQAIIQLILEHAAPRQEAVLMLRLTVSPEEYLMINDNIKIVFLGGSKNNLRIMVDAPREVSIVRSAAMENRIRIRRSGRSCRSSMQCLNLPESLKSLSRIDRISGGEGADFDNNRRGAMRSRARQP